MPVAPSRQGDEADGEIPARRRQRIAETPPLARTIDSLGGLPLTVLFADAYPADLVEPWLALQRELAALSTRGRFIVVDGADHFGLVQRPEFANRVVEEIRRMTGSSAPAG